MLKKFIKINFIIVSLFCLNLNFVKAYDYVDSSNEHSVNEMLIEIYDAKEQYEDLAGGYSTIDIISASTSNSFWWPIGSMETTVGTNGKIFATGEPASTKINSYFGSKENFRINGHGAIDIDSNGYGSGVVNVIASKSGTVVYPISQEQTQYKDNVGNGLGNRDGGGYGNYVKIQHSDGTETLYAHLAPNSITVMAGEVVEQGQVIAKLGHTGNSTGPHLHFEVRKGGEKVDPLDYVDPENPRPVSYGSGNSFSLTTTSLTKEEFVSKMNNYCSRTGNKGFCNNFSANAEQIYSTSLKNDVNPELVVVTAGAEQNWTLSSACSYTNNYWGIGITNGKGCNSGAKYSSISDGIAGYAKVLSNYGPNREMASLITERYNDRKSAGCDASGHGLPGTLEGMQSVYSWLGDYRFNPGSSGLGGCYYLNLIYGSNYCSSVTTCKGSSNCPASSKTTVCEQNDYTSWQLKKKSQIRFDIFGI